MNCRLRSYDQTPPGGYPYVQEQGIRREFPSQPLIEAQAQAVAGFRKGNGLPRSSSREALEDVDRYNARRLGCMSQWTVPTDQNNTSVALNSSSPTVAPPCSGCGVKV